ncbi:MAG: Autotransporter assembly factor TamA [Candidatus Accumulibacter appositus]|uniref:Autotransporter assembly factor TamA n=1 Tax=Candidatus Accumulibacter appositus TaxID=1454003 RepID=A0A011QPL9_9PROT|nr:autotransporter assembly complex family protein [Accumulibacter sp.]EXI80829.1 MAG: Autotransporter assembly factor TamA [Candidatus Accumulibacter appositus]HRF06347.1 autotransporter assembly complex family protein [Accumulibacter sp.]
MHKSVVLAALLLALPVAAAVPQLQAPDEVRQLLTEYVELGEVADAPEQAALERRMEREVPALLATEGYFSPQVVVKESDGKLLVEVDPGPRSIVASVHIEILGDVGAARRKALTDSWKLKSGQPFRQADWDDAKQSLLADLLSVDFAAARLEDSGAQVDPEARRVELRVVLAAGPPYSFGELKISGLKRYPSSLVERYNHSVDVGEPYREDRLLALQTALQDTPFFGSVVVSLDRGKDDERSADGPDGRVSAPVLVHVRERAPYEVSLGAGFSTNTGARVEANYRSSDLFDRAWELHTGVRIEQLRQTAYADVFFPPDKRRRRDGVGMAFQNSDIENLALETFAVGATRVQQRGSVEQRLGLNWQTEKQTPKGSPTTTNEALTAQAGWTWRHAPDPLRPSEGISLQFQLGGASKQLLSDQDFVRTYLRYAQGVQLGERDGLLLRAELGATFAPSSDGIPQDFLFRAGGSNSVRGYAYQSLGVQQGEAVVGGRYLMTMSAEYTHWITPVWGAAAFVDAGDAQDSRDAFDLAVGYGLGARWKSPVGPLGLDLAYGQREGKLRFDFSLAVPF